MRILFLNRFYWPEETATGQLLTDIAEALATAGHDVTVITSRPPGAGIAGTETHQGVKIQRVSGTRWAASAGLAGKAVDYVTYYIAALLILLRVASGGSVVVAMTDPPMLGVGAWLVARLRGARVVHWIQDVYPEIAIALSGHRWLGLLRPLRNAAWRHADGCVTLGADMAEVAAEAGVSPSRIHIIANAAPAELASAAAAGSPLRQEWGLAGKFVVAYSGNLGRVHVLDPVLAAAERLRDRPDIRFLLIGDGAQRQQLVEAVRARALPNVVFRPPQPRARLADSLAVADVHLVTLRPGCERYVYPSKFHGVMVVGRPVLFIGPPECELARHVRNTELGLTFAPDEHAAMATAVAHLAADAAGRERFAVHVRTYAAVHESRAATVAAWQSFLAQLETALPVGPAIQRTIP